MNKSLGVGPRDPGTDVFNVSLSDPRIKEVGIDPHSLYGKGITEAELQRRLAEKISKRSVSVGARKTSNKKSAR